MFDPVTAALLQSAPELPDLDPETLPRLLTAQYARLVARRLRGAAGEGADAGAPGGWTLAKIADAYEIVASVHSDPSIRRAAAFVAATAHQILSREAVVTDGEEKPPILDRDRVDPAIAASVLFLGAEQYADAHEAAASIDPDSRTQSYVATIVAEHIRDLARGKLKSILDRGARWRRPDAGRGNLEDRATAALYEALATGIEMLAAYMLAEVAPAATAARFESAREPFENVLSLSTRLHEGYDRELGGELLTTYPGPGHLASLLLTAHDGIADAALARIPPPDGSDPAYWQRWLRHRAESAPFVWPNHREATAKGFHESGNSAVLVLLTGAGKTTVSGLKIAGVLARGKKVVFLAPTHALVDQLTEDLQAMFPKDLIGTLVSSDFDLLLAVNAEVQQIEVMTPERCLAMLSFSPEAFEDVGLLVFDECHLLSPKAGNLRRALDGMFCVLAFNSLIPDADFLFLSAMLRNGEQFARWIKQLTGRQCIFADPLWKPSRQARGVVLYKKSELAGIRQSAMQVQRSEDTRARKVAQGMRAKAKSQLVIRPHALFGLQHNWLEYSPELCTIAPISKDTVLLEGERDGLAIRLKPNVNKVAAYLAGASAQNALKAIVFVNAKSHTASTAREIASLLGDPPQTSGDEERLWNALEVELGNLQHSYIPGPANAVPHHAGMLRLERELAERLFRRVDGAKVIVATPTLAEGLNLPAHIAILAGDKRADLDDGGREALEAHEILNAAARAGRAGHLANGVVLLIPEAILEFAPTRPLTRDVVEKLKSILPEDDRCISIDDPLQAILDRISASAFENADLECALNRLSTTISPEGVEGGAATNFSISRSFAAFIATEKSASEIFDTQVGRLREALARRIADPDDTALIELAAQSGTSITVLKELRDRLAAQSAFLPTTIEAWVSWTLDWLSSSDAARKALLEGDRRTILGAVGRGKTEQLTSEDVRKLRPALFAWIKGEPLSKIEQGLGGTSSTATGMLCPRSRDLVTALIPRTISFIIGLVARAVRELSAEDCTMTVPVAVIDCMATAVRRGFDTPKKLAFAELKKEILSRVELHSCFAEYPLDLELTAQNDYSAVKSNVAAIVKLCD